MKQTNIGIVLHKIRGNYLRLRQITEHIDAEAAPEELLAHISRREEIISEIKHEEQYLEHQCAGWHEACEQDPGLTLLKNDIQRLIAAIIALDGALQNIIGRKMESLKSEIATFTNSSKAVLSYARHSY